MNAIIRALSAFTLSVPTVAVLPYVATAQEIPNNSQPRTTQKLCSFDAIQDLLPSAANQQSRSPLSYLTQHGFTQKQDGSWVCYAQDNQQQERYYTLFKVQQINGTLVASSFLDNGSLMEGQADRSLGLFMTVIEKHTKTNQGNSQSIHRYLESFISLVQQGKIPASQKGYLFDQPSTGIVVYHPVTEGELKGTAITININSPQNLSSSSVSWAESLRGRM